MRATKTKTLRDEFALAADGFSDSAMPGRAAPMAGVRAPTAKQELSSKFMAAWWIKAEAAYRYRQADEMMKARKK